MKINFFRPSIEKDFECFVKNLPALEPQEFLGLARLLGVKLTKLDDNSTELENWKKADEEERAAILEKATLSTEEILEQMMDKFLELSKKRRREIVQMLKEIRRGA